jgi:hypothetical protein
LATPEVVVHLRAADGSGDARAGLDDKSLRALGDMLPRKTTYLVTNRVEWFDLFEKRYGWKHPSWDTVVHSALGMNWGQRAAAGGLGAGESSERKARQQYDKARQHMQLWADWYTILMARRVYHTHSDFSNSAIHWMNVEGHSIVGYDDSRHELLLTGQSWIVDGETPPLIERRRDAPGTLELRLCGNQNYDVMFKVLDAIQNLTTEFRLESAPRGEKRR